MATMTNPSELLGQIEAKIKSENAALNATQNELQRLNAQKAAVQAMNSEIERSHQAIEDQRLVVDAEIKGASTVYGDLKARLEQPQYKEVREQVEKAIAAISDPIGKQSEKCKEAANNADVAQTAQLESHIDVLRQEPLYQEAKKKLQRLPTEISAAKAEVARIRALAKAAHDGARMNEVWWRVIDFKAAIDTLTAKASLESSLRTDMETKGLELEDKKYAAAEKTSALTECEKALEEAETHLETLEQEREALILKELKL